MDRRMIRNKLNHVATEVVTAYENGLTLKELGAFHGVSQGTIRNLLESKGIKLRGRGRRKKHGKNKQTSQPDTVSSGDSI